MTAFEYGKKAADAIMEQYAPHELCPQRFFAYYNGVFLAGVEKLYKKTGDKKYYDYIKDWVDFHINEDGTLNETGVWARLTSLDFRKSGTLLFDIYSKTGDKKYWNIIEYLVESLKYFPKNKYGGFWHATYHEEQMWLDGLYMAGPICTMYAQKTGKSEFLEMAIRQIEIMWDHTIDEKSGLMVHGWDDNRKDKKAQWADPDTGLSQEVWGRAQGWYVVAICDMLEYIPTDHPKRPKIEMILNTMLKRIIKYQDQVDGRWFEVVDKGHLPGNWYENSCSCLFVNAIAQAIQKGCLEKEYAESARKGFEGIIASLQYDENDRLVLPDNCVGTAIESGTYQYYIDRPRCSNDLHGSGTFILMCYQMEELEAYLNKQ